MVVFSEVQSYLIYFSATLLASAFAGIAQRINFYKKERGDIKNIFLILSFLCLFLPVAFRGYGVDHESYLSLYNKISEYGLFYLQTYEGTPEPLFMIINFIAVYIGDFQYVYIISSFISLFFTYKAFIRKINEISLSMCVWMFASLYYLNLFGLVRISIAVGIITYAYKYIEESNFKKYSTYVIFATLFHYSALIMLPLYIIFKDDYSNTLRSKSIKKSWLTLVILLLVFVISGYFIEQFEHISWLGRYKQYFEGTSFSVINNIGGQYFLILMMIIFGKRIKNKEKYGTLYLGMFIAMLIIVFGSIFVSFMRLTYYLYPATYYLYLYVIRALEDVKAKNLYVYVLSSLMTFWFIYKFTSNLWGPFLIPYYLNIPQ